MLKFIAPGPYLSLPNPVHAFTEEFQGSITSEYATGTRPEGSQDRMEIRTIHEDDHMDLWERSTNTRGEGVSAFWIAIQRSTDKGNIRLVQRNFSFFG